MNLTINGENLTVKLESSEELKLEEVVTAYQLSTGNYEALFVPKENNLEEKGNNLEEKVDNFEEKQPWHVESREEPTNQDEPHGHFFEKGESVNVEVLCPFCGHTGKATTRFGFSFTKCPNCREKLFNAYAEDWPEVSEKDFVYRASDPMKFKGQQDEFEQMFKGDATNDQ